jgi:hypothetical protein
MDPSLISRKSAKVLPEINASYNFDSNKFSKTQIAPYLRNDGHYQTNSHVHVKYIRTCTGVMLPIIAAKRPAAPEVFQNSNSNLKTNNNNSSDYTNPDINDARKIGSEIRRFLKSGRSDSELGNYIQSIQHHKRDFFTSKK